MNNPTIYFICPTNKFVAGGVKQIYKMVEILNKNGINAVLLLKRNKKENWFNADVSIEASTYLFKKIKFSYKHKTPNFWERLYLYFLKQKSVVLKENSILVFPEVFGPKINEIEPNIKKVIFNQNCYYTFEHFISDDLKNNLYNNENTIGTIVVSEDSKNYLKYIFPMHKTFRLKIGINTDIFSFSEKKEKIISFMPRKLSEDSSQIINILNIRGKLNGWKIVPIENKNESEVAKILKKSSIFLSFNHSEGFGLPPLEAMSCGCYIIGYHGEGGKEYLNPHNSSLIEKGNIIGFAQEIEKIVKRLDENDSVIRGKIIENSSFVLKNFNLEDEKESILEIWKTIINTN